MTKYKEILRLLSLNLTTREIQKSCSVSSKTIIKTKKRAAELGISWPLADGMTEAKLADLMLPKPEKAVTDRRLPDMYYIDKEMLRNGVTKKLLWNEYLETCKSENAKPLMYSQFCYYIQMDQQKRHATMHLDRIPGKQVEVDWAGSLLYVTDQTTGKVLKAYLFVSAMSYSTYAYAEAFPNMQTPCWIKANVHMLEFLGGVPRVIVPDNTSTAVQIKSLRKDKEINHIYQEFAEHYNTAILPARSVHPKDKPVTEGTVGNLTTFIIAALRNEKFLSFGTLNARIRELLEKYNNSPFTAKEGCRAEVFRNEELPLLAHLPASPYELASWKKAKVQFNYHITLEYMHYSVPYVLIGKDVDVRVTDTTIEIFYKQERVASHKRLTGRKGQYSTIRAHMPEEHQKYQEWNGERFRNWARQIGPCTARVTEAILKSKAIEEQAYLSCRSFLKLSDVYSKTMLEAACGKALQFSQAPSYKTVKAILAGMKARQSKPADKADAVQDHVNPYAVTRGAEYYGGDSHAE